MPAKLIRFALLPLSASVLVAALLSGCEQPTSRLEQMRDQGTVRMITRNTPTTFYQDRHGNTGLEFELSKRFADSLNLELDVQTIDTLDDFYQQMTSATGPDLGAAGITVNPQRADQVHFSTPYMDVISQVVYRRGDPQPRTIEDLYGKRIMVLKDSTLADQLRELQIDHPQLVFEESDRVEVVDLLRLVNDDEIDHAVVYSNELVVNQAFYPAVRVGFDLSEPQPMVWASR
jgi:membrane-bound lytic murein transglycosylase F